MPAAELAEHTNVPVHYLGKVMRKLVVAGLASARKGHGGGFSLRHPPAQVSYADILAATGHTEDDGQCAFGWSSCDDGSPCPLHDAWCDLRGKVDAWAKATTLDEVAR